MKKLLLISCCLMLSYSYIQAQIIVYCQSPASVTGNKAFTWGAPSGGWGTADLNIPANSITDTVMLVHDGTIGDTLGCSPLINDLTGKIALVYRGSCEFGVKAHNAQLAGAVGCIIVNNAAGAPVGIGPGAQGANVTIPTVMISQADGAALRAAVDAAVISGNNQVVVFIGNKFGLYANDLGFYAIDARTSRVTANPSLISTSATEFNVPMGGWVHNYGINAQSGVTLNATISGAATYTASSIALSLNHGDSAYVTIPTYSASSYSGLYKVKYSIKYGATDDFTADNSFFSDFLIDSLFSYALIDTVTKKPVSSANLEDNATTIPAGTQYLTCVHFRDAHASRLAALGIYASAGTLSTYNGGTGLDGETVESIAYEWNNVFTGLSDPAFPATSSAWNLNQLGSGSYTYSSNLQSQMIYIPFSAPVTLVDNKRYLFCNRTYNRAVSLGFDTHFNYVIGMDSTDQPISIAMVDTAIFATGFGTDATSSVSVKFGPSGLGVNEQNGKSFDVTPFPNPTNAFIRIPLSGMNGTAQLKIMDVNGKVVSTQTVKVADDLTLNVSGIPNGNYVFNMLFKDGRNTTFKVVITK